MSTYSADYYRDNREKVLAKMKEYREANPEKIREYQRSWKAANEGHTYEDPTGYVKYIGYSHPIANPSGITAHHRIILWEKLNGQDAPCNWCGKQLYWSKKFPAHDALVTDHVNTVKNDNDPENLVPSCALCNITREGGQNRRIINEGPCSVEFCEKDATVKGMCQTHYMHVWSGKEPMPIGPYRKGGIGHRDENGRDCTECDEYKSWDNYYVRKNGQVMAKCKACMVAKSQAAKEARLAKNTPCSVDGCENPTDVKNLCVTHYGRDYYERNNNK